MGRERLKGKELQVFSFFTAGILLVTSFLMGSPREILEGMRVIILSRDALITDYFELAGYGAAFFNAFLVVSVCLALLAVLKVPYTGLTIAALFINMGYGLWGKNPLNMLPFLMGTLAYAWLHRVPFNRYIYTALFGTCLAPFATEMVHILPFSPRIDLFLATIMGMFMGYLLVPLSVRTASMHMGYTLFNVGFSGGILAFVVMCIMRSYGVESHPVMIWTEGVHKGLLTGVLIYLIFTILYGLWLCQGKLGGLKDILRRSGRAVTDFTILDGVGATFMNMGLVGIAGLVYILLTGGDLSGPVLGALASAFGFAAFGAHLRNYLPVLAGVFLSAVLTDYTAAAPGLQLAALFAVGLAPVAGQFGVFAGLVAGMIHSSVAMCTAQIYGGLNLYNNGFSTGWVAIIMVPLCESFIERYEMGKRRKKNKKGE